MSLFPFPAFSPRAGTEVTVTATMSSADNLVTYTFTDQSLGAPDDDRYIVAAVSTRDDNTSGDVAACTIAGVAATSVIQIGHGGGVGVSAELFIAHVPTGATGTITIGGGSALVDCGCTLYRLTGIASPTASDTDSAQDGGSLSIDVAARGIAIAVVASSVDGASFTWTGLDEDQDYDTDGGSAGVQHSTAHRQFSSAVTGHTVSATNANALGVESIVCAAWDPA